MANILSKLANYGVNFAPKNNRKRTRGRNYKFVQDKESGKTRKQWITY